MRRQSLLMKVSARLETFLKPILAQADKVRHAQPGEPFTDGSGRELTAVVAPDVLGIPRRMNRSIRRSNPSSAFNRRATSIDRHSRVYSSITVNSRSGRPLLVRSAMKS